MPRDGKVFSRRDEMKTSMPVLRVYYMKRIAASRTPLRTTIMPPMRMVN